MNNLCVLYFREREIKFGISFVTTRYFCNLLHIRKVIDILGPKMQAIETGYCKHVQNATYTEKLAW